MERPFPSALAPISFLANPMARLDHWRRQLTVPQFTVVTGLLVIAAGTIVLASPACSSNSVGLWEALFTVTSAITVTGLSIIDIGKELTLFGQMVLAGLIITGGLGLMAITTFLQGFVQGRSGLRHRLDRGRALDEFGVGGIGPTFNSILLTAALIMGLGTVILYSFGFTAIENPAARLWASLFHCISAYNNAGFGLFSDNLVGYRANPVVNGVIGSLIVIGGIGWRVTNDLWTKRFRLHRLRNLSLHTRLVLRSTALLIVLGAFGLLFTEQFAPDGVISTLSFWERLQVTLFQSITTRTAGFNTVPLSLETLSDAGLLLMIGLMFIGASPGGTGGGIKTTTFALLLGATRSTLDNRKEVVIRKRLIAPELILKAVGVTVASGLFVVGMTLLLGLGRHLQFSGEVFHLHVSLLHRGPGCGGDQPAQPLGPAGADRGDVRGQAWNSAVAFGALWAGQRQAGGVSGRGGLPLKFRDDGEISGQIAGQGGI
jgi:Trk-type K+ transport system membrane component